MSSNINKTISFKFVGGYYYFHASQLGASNLKLTRGDARQLNYNVVKANGTLDKYSLLEYGGFFELEFPELKKSYSSHAANGVNQKIRKYSEENPPILHRKELLLPPDHPDIPKFAALTKQLEEAGLFKEDPSFCRPWEEGQGRAGGRCRCQERCDEGSRYSVHIEFNSPGGGL